MDAAVQTVTVPSLRPMLSVTSSSPPVRDPPPDVMATLTNIAAAVDTLGGAGEQVIVGLLKHFRLRLLASAFASSSYTSTTGYLRLIQELLPVVSTKARPLTPVPPGPAIIAVAQARCVADLIYLVLSLAGLQTPDDSDSAPPTPVDLTPLSPHHLAHLIPQRMWPVVTSPADVAGALYHVMSTAAAIEAAVDWVDPPYVSPVAALLTLPDAPDPVPFSTAERVTGLLGWVIHGRRGGDLLGPDGGLASVVDTIATYSPVATLKCQNAICRAAASLKRATTLEDLRAAISASLHHHMAATTTDAALAVFRSRTAWESTAIPGTTRDVFRAGVGLVDHVADITATAGLLALGPSSLVAAELQGTARAFLEETIPDIAAKGVSTITRYAGNSDTDTTYLTAAATIAMIRGHLQAVLLTEAVVRTVPETCALRTAIDAAIGSASDATATMLRRYLTAVYDRAAPHVALLIDSIQTPDNPVAGRGSLFGTIKSAMRRHGVVIKDAAGAVGVVAELIEESASIVKAAVPDDPEAAAIALDALAGHVVGEIAKEIGSMGETGRQTLTGALERLAHGLAGSTAAIFFTDAISVIHSRGLRAATAEILAGNGAEELKRLGVLRLGEDVVLQLIDAAMAR